MIDEQEKVLRSLRKYSSNIYVNDIFRIVLNSDEKIRTLRMIDKLSSILMFISWVILSGFIFYINIYKKKDINDSSEIGIARVSRTELKVRKFNVKIQIITDDIMNKDFSMYQIGSRIQRLIFMLFHYVRLCIKDYIEIFKIIKEEEILQHSVIILRNITKRIPHTVVYKYAIESIVKNYKSKIIYTGQMYDRFAIAEYQISKKYNKHLVCIPHGVESTLEMPVAYVGDKFYCTSDYMCEKLKKLYQTDKFIFVPEVTDRLFKIESKINGDRKFVFFTQPINREKLIITIKTISNMLNIMGQVLYLKVHPADNILYYESCDAITLSNFEDAIMNNICISATSTVLLECLYNQSIAISIINLLENDVVFDKDLEYLNDPRINKPKNEVELKKLLYLELDNMKEEVNV